MTDREQSASLLGLPGVAAVGAAAWIARGIQLEIQQYARNLSDIQFLDC
jgi:hypothetical protein